VGVDLRVELREELAELRTAMEGAKDESGAARQELAELRTVVEGAKDESGAAVEAVARLAVSMAAAHPARGSQPATRCTAGCTPTCPDPALRAQAAALRIQVSTQAQYETLEALALKGRSAAASQAEEVRALSETSARAEVGDPGIRAQRKHTRTCVHLRACACACARAPGHACTP